MAATKRRRELSSSVQPLPFIQLLSPFHVYNISRRLDHLGRCKLSTKDIVPESTCNPETILIICKVMLQMIPFELTVVRREAIGSLA